MNLAPNSNLFQRYIADPLGCDEEVRQACGIPDDCYYTVSIWPIAGMVTVDHRRSRAVKANKISKSNQSPA
jgi:hypothetical protein